MRAVAVISHTVMSECYELIMLCQRQRSRSINIDLQLLGVQKCSMCLVLGASDFARIDNALVDKRSILTTKNILSLRAIEDKMAKIGG